MATSKEYKSYVQEQLGLLEDIRIRAMMGEYLIYYQDKLFGGIYDNRLLVKITKESKEIMPRAKEEIPYPGAKPMLLVEDIEDREFLKELVCKMCENLPQRK